MRHSAMMLLVYAALIGGAGWLLVATPQGFIPAQDRGYVIISVQLPGAASLARTTEVVREIEKIALDTPGVIACRGVRRLLRRYAHPGKQCRGAVPGVRGPGRSRTRKG